MNENRPNLLASIAKGPARETSDDEIDLGALLGVLWRDKWLIAAVTVLFILAGGIYVTSLATPLYRATAELALKQQQDQVISDIESVISSGGASSEMINTEIDVMTSRKILGRLVDRLDLIADAEFNETLRDPALFSPGALIGLITGGDDEPPPTEGEIRNSVIDKVGEAISASNRRDSLTLVIDVTTEDPVKSARIANTLAELYVDNQLQEKIEATERASAFLSTRTAELKQELDAAQSKLNSFRDQAELVSEEQLAAKSAQFKTLRTRHGALQTDVAAARSRLERLRALLASEDYETLAEEAASPALVHALSARAAGEGRETDLRRAAAEAVAGAETRLSRQQEQLATLEDTVEQFGAELDRQSEELVRLQQMEREVEATRLLYESFLSRLKETNIQRGLAQSDVRMLSEAVPREASSPKVSLILTLSGVLGVMVGSGIVLGREAKRQGLRTTDELAQATGHTVLGTIPALRMRRRADMIRYLRENPTSGVAEAVRNLRTSILLSNIDDPPKVIMVTSSVPGEGKTTISLALAQNMAALGQRILLIEGDLRRRAFPRHLDIEGATELLGAMEDQTVLDTGSLEAPELGVDVLVGTKIRINAADLFSSQKFRDLIAAARDRYDHVIIDTPPVLLVPDARVIGQEADAILLAVKWDETGRTEIREALEMFRTVELRVTGLVLSQVDSRRMRRYSYGGKYGYDAYHSKYYDS